MTSNVNAGTWIGGYTLVRPLGKGGRGTVWEAKDEGGNSVALKLLHPISAGDDAARARILRESRLVNRIPTAQVAKVQDVEADAFVPFVVTELIEGPTLDEMIQSGPLSEDQALQMGHMLARVLEEVHGAGVAHRDLKPSNIIVRDGAPVLIDFELSRAEDHPQVTVHGQVLGTPGYLAPELLAGTPNAGALSSRTPSRGGDELAPLQGGDWFAWAATLLTTMTGQPPFGAGRVEQVLANVAQGKPSTEGLQPWQAEAFQKALHPNPSMRSTPRELLETLKAAPFDAVPAATSTMAQGEPPTPPRGLPWTTTRKNGSEAAGGNMGGTTGQTTLEVGGGTAREAGSETSGEATKVIPTVFAAEAPSSTSQTQPSPPLQQALTQGAVPERRSAFISPNAANPEASPSSPNFQNPQHLQTPLNPQTPQGPQSFQNPQVPPWHESAATPSGTPLGDGRVSWFPLVPDKPMPVFTAIAFTVALAALVPVGWAFGVTLLFSVLLILQVGGAVNRNLRKSRGPYGRMPKRKRWSSIFTVPWAIVVSLVGAVISLAAGSALAVGLAWVGATALGATVLFTEAAKWFWFGPPLGMLPHNYLQLGFWLITWVGLLLAWVLPTFIPARDGFKEAVWKLAPSKPKRALLTLLLLGLGVLALLF